MKTFLPKVDEIERRWYVIDATDQVLGRMAVTIANMLRGKHKPTFTPHLDCGDFIIVVNADKVKLTGRKETRKVHQYYSRHMGGQTERTVAELRRKHPEWLIKEAVWGMLPKGRLGRDQYRKLRVYAGAEHPHAAQKVETLAL